MRNDSVSPLSKRVHAISFLFQACSRNVGMKYSELANFLFQGVAG